MGKRRGSYEGSDSEPGANAAGPSLTPASDIPLTDDEFAHRMDVLWPHGPFAVAVSGGCDSRALLDLAAAYARTRSRTFTVLTVDHGLRGESAREAQSVAEIARALDAPHVILRWEGEKPRANIEAAARAARYGLMCAWCVAHGVGAILTAHTLNDQAETLIMRLARGSGVDGLSAMAERRDFAGVAIVRPLLDMPRARLRARLEARAIGWLDDAMNEDTRYLRVRVRQAAPALAELGLTPERLAATAQRMRRARIALDEMAGTVFAATVTVAPHGSCDVDLAALRAAPSEIGLRVLARVVMGVGGLVYRPRHDRLERLYRTLCEDGFEGDRTLAGCRIRPSGKHAVQVLREAAMIEDVPVLLAGGETRLWDRRFAVSLRRGAALPGAEVRALGALSTRALEAAGGPLQPCAALLRATLPGLWVNGTLVSVPLLGFERPCGEYVAGAFHTRFVAFEGQNASGGGSQA